MRAVGKWRSPSPPLILRFWGGLGEAAFSPLESGGPLPGQGQQAGVGVGQVAGPRQAQSDPKAVIEKAFSVWLDKVEDNLLENLGSASPRQGRGQQLATIKKSIC